ncbi:MAG: LCP family protein [Patescibacteria group bacterium]
MSKKILVLLIILVAGGLLWRKTQVVETTEKKLPVNILLLGYGGEGHDGANLTDTMIIAHLDAASKSAVLVSVPRDIWYGDSKINAYFEKDPSTALRAVTQVTGLPIDKYVAGDFAGFTEIIDLLGGVDVKVETAFDDPEYPIAGKENDPCYSCRFENLRFEAGVIHMDGQTALKFVRSRHSAVDGTDFGRSVRQRNLLLAVREKVMSLNVIPQLPALYIKLRDHVRTDFTLEDLKYFLPKAGEFANYKVSQVALTDENVLQYAWSDEGQMILIPKEGAEKWEGVRKWVGEQLR